MSSVAHSLSKRQIVFIMSILLAAILAACGAQAEPRKFVVGEISNIPNGPNPVTTNGVAYTRQGSFHTEMEKIGYVEDKNVTYIFDPEALAGDQLTAAAQKLVEAKVDVIVAYGTTAALVAKEATANTTIPVVFVGSVDPVQLGLVTSLQNTEGNVTGIGGTSDAYAKQLEWLLKLDPTIKRVYVPYPDIGNPLAAAAVKSIEDFGKKSGIEVISEAFAPDADPDASVAKMPDVDAIINVPFSPFISQYIALALEKHLPLTRAFPNSMDGGGLFSYNYTEQTVGSEAAHYVDRILRGAKPSDLPVQLATNSLAINLKTAQAIGLNISDEILRQAEAVVR
jgi:putative ABC transport system substrate-binding protein